MAMSNEATEIFQRARDSLLSHRQDYDSALRAFAIPEFGEFNWAIDWFDAIGRGNNDIALWVVEEDGTERKFSFEEMASRSNQVANWLRSHGVVRGDRIIVMLGNQVELWETVLAVMKLGAILIPATTLLGRADLEDRIARGHARHVVVNSDVVEKFDGIAGDYARVSVGGMHDGWLDYADAHLADDHFVPDGVTGVDETFLLYFTSGTTAKPKLVEHTHSSYPVGHLSTMYWIGLQPGDVHLNISSPGWAKHAWSSLFAPWNAQATVLVYNYSRFNATALLEQINRCGVTTFCAPPTVWRMLAQANLGGRPAKLREVVSAGEPLNPSIIEYIQDSWGLTVRDGYGQTETTAQIGNTPGQRVKPGSMGRALPGYKIALLDPMTGKAGTDGEICIDLSQHPIGLMVGYQGNPELNAEVMRDGHYHTGDVASVDDQGYITYVGRTDDIFKASDYRISPFELESVLLEHEAVAEVAVVPSPDELRLSVPKAYVSLAAGFGPDRATALSIFRFSRENLAPYKRISRLEFFDLPKTISGKIRRVDLRQREQEMHGGSTETAPNGWRVEDFPELTS